MKNTKKMNNKTIRSRSNGSDEDIGNKSRRDHSSTSTYSSSSSDSCSNTDNEESHSRDRYEKKRHTNGELKVFSGCMLEAFQDLISKMTDVSDQRMEGSIIA